MSDGTAAAKVFAIPELLKIVLIELSIIDVNSIFALQRLNTTFNDTINTTKKIRCNICLDPALETDEEEGTKELRLNPLCSDERIGGLLWPALRVAWAPIRERRQTDYSASLDYYPKAPRNWGVMQHGSWRSTIFARTAKSHWVSVTMINALSRRSDIFIQPQVQTHTTLGEIVDGWVKWMEKNGPLSVIGYGDPA